MPLGFTVYHPDRPQLHAYFPIDALISLQCVMRNGGAGETAMVGGLIRYRRGLWHPRIRRPKRTRFTAQLRSLIQTSAQHCPSRMREPDCFD
jgi:hypothetical protein